MRPYEAAFVSAGSPVGDEPTIMGTCAVTGVPAEGWPVGALLGASFGDWDKMPFIGAADAVVSRALRWALHADAEPGARVWLTKCFAWEIRCHSATMFGELFVKGQKPDGRTAWGCLAHPDRLGAALAEPVGSDRCVTVPDGGQIHVLAWADWGTVATDRWSGRWSPADVETFQAVVRLRNLGFGEKALALPVVPTALAAKLGVDPFDVIDDWAALDRFRREPARLRVATMATRQRKDVPDGK